MRKYEGGKAPIKVTFTLLTTTHPPTMSVNPHVNNHPEFVCTTPWFHKKITRFDNTNYTALAVNVHQPYPTPYLVGEIWCL